MPNRLSPKYLGLLSVLDEIYLRYTGALFYILLRWGKELPHCSSKTVAPGHSFLSPPMIHIKKTNQADTHRGTIFFIPDSRN